MLLVWLAAILIPTAAAGALWLKLRKTQRAPDVDLLSTATFEQSCQAMIWLDGKTLEVILANAAFLKKSGYSNEEVAGLSASSLFVDQKHPETLLAQLREPVAHGTRKMRLRRKDGQTIEVDLMGHPIQWAGRRVLAYTCHDVSLWAKFESQLLEKQRHLDHLAHHDQLTGLPNRLFLAAHLPRRAASRCAEGSDARG